MKKLYSPWMMSLLVLPWLFPYAAGPSPWLPQWLCAAACAALLWLGRATWSADMVLRGWRWAAAISALMGLVQYLGGSSSMAPWISVTSAGEAYANLRQRNQYATLTSIGLAATLWLAACQRDRDANPRWLDLAFAVLLAAGNAASSSRTGALQLLLLTLLAGLWGLWRHVAVRRLLLAAGLTYLTALLVLPVMIGQPSEEVGMLARLREGETVCGSRYPLWTNVLHLIGLRPWLGWGWGELDYAHFITPYPGERFCELLDNAHNLPLHLAVELGLPVTLLILALVTRWVWRRQPWREMDAVRQAAWAVIALLALHSMFEYPLWYGPFQLALGLGLSLLIVRRTPAGKTDAGTGRRDLLLVTSICLLLGYLAWDYHRISQIYLPAEQRAAAYREDPWRHARDSWVFRKQVDFAEYSVTPLTPANALMLHDMGETLLHYSPEARVVEKLIESATLLGRGEEAAFYLERFRAAYPKDYARWSDRARAVGVGPD